MCSGLGCALLLLQGCTRLCGANCWEGKQLDCRGIREGSEGANMCGLSSESESSKEVSELVYTRRRGHAAWVGPPPAHSVGAAQIMLSIKLARISFTICGRRGQARESRVRKANSTRAASQG